MTVITNFDETNMTLSIANKSIVVRKVVVRQLHAEPGSKFFLESSKRVNVVEKIKINHDVDSVLGYRTNDNLDSTA
ncbi:myb-like protein X [Vespula maculifrons]|uniref:Myb-like protein X n=1 Tax=Vespula maculifrons TaxID=7453 RepID=A0ABD2CKU7_VESMC